MKSIASLFFASIFLTALPISQAHALLQSNGLNGAYAPSSSAQLTPDEDGMFHFTTIDIAEQILLSFDRSSWESEIYLLATGDINIYGALDTGPGQLHMYTPGVVTIGGKVYGDTITIAGEEVHYINNPNGNPDTHLYGGVYTTIQPDGELEFSLSLLESPIIEIDATNLSAGLVTTSAGLVMTMYNSYEPLTTIYYLEPPGVMLQTPLPPAIWMLLSAIAVTGLLGHKKHHQA